MEIFRIVRTALNLFFVILPLILINFCLFFAAALGNAGLAMLVAGQTVIVPIAVYLTRFFTQFLGESNVFKASSDLGQLVTSEVYTSDKFNVAPSFWIAQIVFFFSYLFANALDVYNILPVSDSPIEEWRVENRKGRASMIMGLSVFMLIFLVMMRYLATDLETKTGIFIGVLTMAPLAYGWYTAASAIGVRKMDVFGIVQQMVPVTDDKSVTYCAPTQA